MAGFNSEKLPRIGGRLSSALEVLMPGGKSLAGLEITPFFIKTSRVEKRKNGWCLTHWGELPLPPGTVKCSYKSVNVLDMDAFQNAVWSAVDAIGGEVFRMGVSLPNETMKIFVQEFDELPRSGAEIQKMVKWWVGKTFRISPEEFVISYQPLGKSPEGKTRLLVVLAFREIILQYESLLKDQDIIPEIIAPSGINQFNFYSDEIPSSGIIAYIGFFEAYFAFVVIEEGQILFYHGVKKGPSDSHFNHHLDMTLQFFIDACPDKKIERLYMGYPGHYYRDLSEGLMEIIAKDIVIIDESRFISIENGNGRKDEFPMTTYSGGIGSARCVSYFSAAIGAAQSLSP